MQRHRTPSGHAGGRMKRPPNPLWPPTRAARRTDMLVTWRTSHAATGWLKAYAELNIDDMLVTWPTSHAPTGWLKACTAENMYCASRPHARAVSLCVGAPVCWQRNPPLHYLRPIAQAPSAGGGAPPCW